VLHDINLALKFADHILFMKNGSIAAQVSDGNAITPALLKEVFDVDAAVYAIPGRKEKSIVY
jgi:iron complex transport system ATP-binding protein